MKNSQRAGEESCNGTAAKKQRTNSLSAPQQSADSPFGWVADGVQVLLPPSQQVLFSGKGVLTVQSGEVELAGNIRSARSAPLRLSVDSEALRISVVATDATIPLAGTGHAAFSISSRSTQGRRSFDVLLEGDADAPRPFEIPPAWREPASAIAASIDAQRTAGGPPAVVVICGAKKVGKSTFARYLTNTLLNTLPCAAYLDVGELPVIC
jgi:polynucleotide 5'-hydroxyl-kinase GRC3/NOL9